MAMALQNLRLYEKLINRTPNSPIAIYDHDNLRALRVTDLDSKW